MKKIIILSLLILSMFCLAGCEDINPTDKKVTITYDIGEGSWITKPNNKGINFLSETKVTIPAVLDDEVEIAIDSYYPRIGHTKVFPKLVKDGKTYHFLYWKLKGSNTLFDFAEINKTKPGELTPLYDDVSLEAVYNIYPGITNFQSLAPKYRIINNIPSLGSPNILVVPLKFDERSIPLADDKFKQDLDKTFNSTDITDTGFYSVKSYFTEASFTKFTPNFVILDPIYVKNQIKNSNGNFTTLAGLNEKLEAEPTDNPEQFFLNKLYSHDIFSNAVKDLSQDFDIDQNGVLDGIVFVVDGSLNSKWHVNTTRLPLASDIKINNKKLSTMYYTFASYDYLERPLINFPSGITLPNKHIGDMIDGNIFVLNANPFIREIYFQMGLPVLGNFRKGLYNYDALDILSLGDTNAYIKCILGWTEPTIITSAKLKTLNNISLEKDITTGLYKPLLVYNSNLLDVDFTSFFTANDYLLIDYFKPTMRYNKAFGDLGMFFNNEGLRIMHVSPQLDEPSVNLETLNQLSLVFTYSNIKGFAFKDINIKLLDYVAKDATGHEFDLLNNHHKLLYQLNETFNPTKNYRWYPETSIDGETRRIIPNTDFLLNFSLKLISVAGEVKIQIL